MDDLNQKALEDKWFSSVLSKKRSAEARLHRKRQLQSKRAKKLNGLQKENVGKTTPISSHDNAHTRIPFSTISQNIPSSSNSVITNLQKTHASSVISNLANSLNKKRPRVVTCRNINMRGTNLKNRFDNVVGECGSTSSKNSPLHTTEINELFEDDNEEDNMHDDSSESWSLDDSMVMDEDEEDMDNQAVMVNALPPGDFYDIGDPVFECPKCGANMWYLERKTKCRQTLSPKFTMCCGDGKVQIPLLREPPPVLQKLLFDQTNPESKLFQQQIRLFNMMFAFTSPGAKMDNRFNNGRGPPNYRIQGQSCHRIGSMLPLPGQNPRFAQLYIYDTEHEIQHRVNEFKTKDGIDLDIVKKLSSMLYQHNVHAQSFKMARDILSEVAALIVGDVDTAEKRDIIMHKQTGQLQRIDEYHTSYLGFQYPLLFPYGEDGYRPNIRHRNQDSNNRRNSESMTGVADNEDVPWEQANKRNRLTIREWFAFCIQARKNEAQTVIRSRRLFQQFLVDGYTMMESERFRWLRKNQSKLRVGKYNYLADIRTNGHTDGANTGKRVVLPSSYVGSRRYMDQLYFDGMAICSYVGFPDLFITFTCNPNWPELKRVLASNNLTPADRPDLITRIFKMKFDELLSDLTKKSCMGKVLAYMYTIEFQKRGLPHAHILIFLHPSSKYPTPADIDRIISAEIPNKDTDGDLYNLVKSHMIHGPCGNANRSSQCMKDGKCSKYFPKDFRAETVVDQDGYPVYRRRDNGHTVIRNDIEVDNRFVVPYNAKLLLKFRTHINMEWCNQSTSIKYLFKYINKGYDRITAAIVMNENGCPIERQDIDEIKQYIDCRYVSPSEASWRIYGFPIHGRKPAVERLHFHCEGQHSVYYTDISNVSNVLEKPSVTESMFTAWFEANQKYTEAQQLTYSNFVSKFVYVKKKREWKPRQKGYTIGRLIWVPPTTGELYFLRMMLTHVKGPRNYSELKIVNNVKYDTFRDACFAMGFIGDDREFIAAISEAFQWGSGHYLRLLFVHMLLSSSINRPRHVWSKTRHLLSDGILYSQQTIANNRGLRLSEQEIYNLTLIEIEKLLQRNRKSLRDFPGMPKPQGYVPEEFGNKLIYEERNYNPDEQLQEFNMLYQNLTDEQRDVFKQIMMAVNNQNGGVFFLYGYGGTGKTYMWRTLASYIRSKKQICLTVASSGIASLLLPGGRTAHSKFKIPIPTLESSTCDINKGSDRGDLLKLSKLIIWDEAPMCHKFCFEALDKTMKDIMGGSKASNKIFGGKVIVFGGDFRQILPVIPRGSRSDIVHATINSSYIWDHCKVLKLTKNMRLQQSAKSTSSAELRHFSDWILTVGDGKISEPNDGYAEIDVPKDLLISDFDDPLEAIFENTYPNFAVNYNNVDFLQSRAILAGTIETVDQINQYILEFVPGQEKEYLSSDSVDTTDGDGNESFDVLTPEFLNALQTSGVPNHKIKLKIGTPIMLLRNIDQAEGLCNGTRLIVTKLADHVIEAKIISGKNIGGIVYIARMDITPTQSPWPFRMTRRQFPIMVCYAMTINKSQGQSLDFVGIYFPRSVFSHGQFYVAVSRVKSKKGLKILIHDKDKQPLSVTTNVVFKEVFENL
ncbi:uncharacterized protein LOC131597634 [Vicia villosa]|uniref:uncharacterized protein LOC131597634 n=1 Tax=Vicia villosa TaxID=3911 RepID=UPI00273B3997|nr:uncharacterized protein LOC131597634 [Vicia villosa]